MRSSRFKRKAFGTNKRQPLKFVLPLVVVGAALLLIVSRDDGETSDALRPAAVRVEAEDNVCWEATLAAEDETAADPQHEEGCGGEREFPLAGYAGRTVAVSKTSGEGGLTVVVTIDGREIQRRSTTEATERILLTP